MPIKANQYWLRLSGPFMLGVERKRLPPSRQESNTRPATARTGSTRIKANTHHPPPPDLKGKARTAIKINNKGQKKLYTFLWRLYGYSVTSTVVRTQRPKVQLHGSELPSRGGASKGSNYQSQTRGVNRCANNPHLERDGSVLFIRTSRGGGRVGRGGGADEMG